MLDLSWGDFRERRLDLVHEEARTEQREGHDQKGDGFPDAGFRQEETHGARREDKDADGCHDKDDDALRDRHINQQKIRVEDEDEGQGHGAKRIEERGEPGTDGISTRHSRRRETCQPHRRRHIRHDPEVEDEEVNRDQRHNKARLRAPVPQLRPP